VLATEEMGYPTSTEQPNKDAALTQVRMSRTYCETKYGRKYQHFYSM